MEAASRKALEEVHAARVRELADLLDSIATRCGRAAAWLVEQPKMPLKVTFGAAIVQEASRIGLLVREIHELRRDLRVDVLPEVPLEGMVTLPEVTVFAVNAPLEPGRGCHVDQCDCGPDNPRAETFVGGEWVHF